MRDRYHWEKGVLLVRMLNAQAYYGYEYLGNSSRLVITPLTDRYACFVILQSAPPRIEQCDQATPHTCSVHPTQTGRCALLETIICPVAITKLCRLLQLVSSVVAVLLAVSLLIASSEQASVLYYPTLCICP